MVYEVGKNMFYALAAMFAPSPTPWSFNPLRYPDRYSITKGSRPIAIVTTAVTSVFRVVYAYQIEGLTLTAIDCINKGAKMKKKWNQR